jgi:hypothetical protein
VTAIRVTRPGARPRDRAAATGRAHHDEPTALPAGLSAPADGQPSA